MAFPAELMSFKRSKGQIVPSFIMPDSSDYAAQILQAYRSSIGMRRGGLEKKLRQMELGFRYHKIFRAVSLVVQRKCDFEPPSDLDASQVRYSVFLAAGRAIYLPEQRNEVLKSVADSMGTSAETIESSLYADKESELILARIPENLDEDEVCRLYNLGLVETILLKCREMAVIRCDSWIDLARRIKSLGLMYRASGSQGTVESLVVDGPLSSFGNADRYGTRFASLFHWLSRGDDWEIEASVSIKEGRGASPGGYRLKLDSNSSMYFPEFPDASHGEIRGPEWISSFSPSPVSAEGKVYFPDAVAGIGGKQIYLDFSSIQYLEFNSRRDETLRKAGIPWETVYILRPGQKKPQNSIYYHVSVDYQSLKSTLERKYIGGGERVQGARRENFQEEITGEMLNEISRRVEELMPDAEKIVDYIESRGVVPQRVLKLLGYKIKWKGLDLVIYR